MKYQTLIDSGLLLKKKALYTLADFKKLCNENPDMSFKLAKRVIMTSATYHDTDWSDTVANLKVDIPGII